MNWRYVAICYTPGKAGHSWLFTVKQITAVDEATAIAAAEALIGSQLDTPAYVPCHCCGVQVMRTSQLAHTPLPSPTDMLLVDERGRLPASRLHRPKLTPAGRAYLSALLLHGRFNPGSQSRSGGAVGTSRTLRAMGLLSPDGSTVTDLAIRLFGAEIGADTASTTRVD